MKKSSLSPVSESTLSPWSSSAPCVASRERLGWGRAGLEISQAGGIGATAFAQGQHAVLQEIIIFLSFLPTWGQALKPAGKSKCFPNLAKDGLPVLSVLQPPASSHTASTHPGANLQPPTPLQIPLQYEIMPVLTIPCSRLGHHRCCHCHQGTQ